MVSSLVGIVLLAVLLERGMFYKQLTYDIIIDRTTFKWHIHVQRGKGVYEFCVIWVKHQKLVK